MHGGSDRLAHSIYSLASYTAIQLYLTVFGKSLAIDLYGKVL